MGPPPGRPGLAPLPLHADARALPDLGEADREFVLDEWRRIIENAHPFGATGGAFWMNRADRGLAAEHKLLQLQAGHRCGLACRSGSGAAA